MARAIDAFRKRFGDVELIAGNVATADGVRFLLERGVDGIKVGIGPGGGCTTRLNTNYGVPQVQALAECRAAADGRVPLIADGGVKRHGAFVQALTFGGDTVMLGSMLAGTTETPGEIVQKPVVVPDSNKTVNVPFKVFRGMASLQAIVDRLDVEDAEAADVEALGRGGHGSQRARPAARCDRCCATSSSTFARRSATAARSSLARDAGDVPEGPRALRDQADRVEPPRIVRSVTVRRSRAVGRAQPLGRAPRSLQPSCSSDERPEVRLVAGLELLERIGVALAAEVLERVGRSHAPELRADLQRPTGGHPLHQAHRETRRRRRSDRQSGAAAPPATSDAHCSHEWSSRPRLA